MKNIVLCTSAMIESEFVSFQSSARIKPNPSNQNFYAKLIKALSTKNNVNVVSHRPLVKGMFDEITLEEKQTSDDNANYFYTTISTKRTYKLFEEKKIIESTIKKAIADKNETVILVDVLRLNLLKAAKKIGKKSHIKTIGIVTDNPYNLSGVSSLYCRLIMNSARKLDGYLVLSDDLNKLFNKNNKPSYTFEGLVEEHLETKKEPVGNYMFFAGSLYEKYGVKKLIDAFTESKLENKLIIAGAGPLKEYLYNLENKDSRILYLSQISKDKIVSLEQHSICNINPRPLNSKIDRESIPSKFLEYLSSGKPTLSTKHPKLYDIFKDDVIWIDNDSKEGIKQALEQFVNIDEKTLNSKAFAALTKVYNLYGINNQGESITNFLKNI